jgi:hypothetical protein
MANFWAAMARSLEGDTVPIEFTSAIYPYDAESIEALFAYATAHWTRLQEETEIRSR